MASQVIPPIGIGDVATPNLVVRDNRNEFEEWTSLTTNPTSRELSLTVDEMMLEDYVDDIQFVEDPHVPDQSITACSEIRRSSRYQTGLESGPKLVIGPRVGGCMAWCVFRGEWCYAVLLTSQFIRLLLPSLRGW